MTRIEFRAGIITAITFVVFSLYAGCARRPPGEDCIAVSRPPAVFPDYSNTVIPPNIAPLNFTVGEDAAAYHVRISAAFGRAIDVRASSPAIRIPRKLWRNLLSANKGQDLRFDVYVKETDGSWRRFVTVTNTIANESIDSHVVYRLIPPIHHSWHKIEIRERCIEDFRERAIVDNRTFGRGCVNCHTFMQNRPETMSLQIRSQRFGLPMIVVKGDEIRNVDTRTGRGISPAAYHSWHPGGSLIAFSRNKPSPFEHTGHDIRDVLDYNSDLAVYFVDENRVEVPPVIADPEWRETWPSWSADGKHLYFCRSPQMPVEKFDEVRYDLMRIAYDYDSNTWGEPEVLVSGERAGCSTAQPRESPNGRWLLFSMCKYGSFPIYQRSSDLYVMDLGTRQYRRLAINSDLCDSWHGWSSNGRWAVFASKRGNGLMARIYFSYVDDAGRFYEPVLLPQRDPGFYNSCVRTFNIPELVNGPVRQTAARFGAAICETGKALKATGSPSN